MGLDLNQDYRSMLCAFNEGKVRYLLVGAYGMAIHGRVRATLGLDLWVEPTAANGQLVLNALDRVRVPLSGLTDSDFDSDDLIYQIGNEPVQVTIITSLTGLQFEEAFTNSMESSYDGVTVHTLSIDDFIRNKKATGRLKDLWDAETLDLIKNRPQDDS